MLPPTSEQGRRALCTSCGCLPEDLSMTLLHYIEGAAPGQITDRVLLYIEGQTLPGLKERGKVLNWVS